MYMLVAKSAWALLQPSNLIAFLLLLGLLIHRFSRSKGLKCLVIGATLLVFGGLLPTGQLLLAPLENRFPPLSAGLPAHVDGIIILGGGEVPALSFARHQIILNNRSERLIYGAILARRYPLAKVVHSGGCGAPGEMLESDVAKGFFGKLGLTGDRFIYENRSRNSYENAVFTKNLVRPKPGEVWLLVTSAFHMPRAIGAFREAGWQVRAVPVDYYSANNVKMLQAPDVSARLAELDIGVHEWVGLAAYRLLGKSSALFPAP